MMFQRWPAQEGWLPPCCSALFLPPKLEQASLVPVVLVVRVVLVRVERSYQMTRTFKCSKKSMLSRALVVVVKMACSQKRDTIQTACTTKEWGELLTGVISITFTLEQSGRECGCLVIPLHHLRQEKHSTEPLLVKGGLFLREVGCGTPPVDARTGEKSKETGLTSG